MTLFSRHRVSATYLVEEVVSSPASSAAFSATREAALMISTWPLPSFPGDDGHYDRSHLARLLRLAVSHFRRFEISSGFGLLYCTGPIEDSSA